MVSYPCFYPRIALVAPTPEQLTSYIDQEALSMCRCRLASSRNRLIFNMGIPVPGIMVLILRRDTELCHHFNWWSPSKLLSCQQAHCWLHTRSYSCFLRYTSSCWWFPSPCCYTNIYYKLHQIPKIKYMSSRLAFVFAQSIETRCLVENEDVVGSTPRGGAPTTSW